MTGANMEKDDYFATLRPSMTRRVSKGESYWTSVDLLAWDSGQQAAAIRSCLEDMSVRVNFFPVGLADHVVNVLAGKEHQSPFIILACHGDSGAILLPGLAEEIARFQKYVDRLGPNEIRQFGSIDGATVISTGCETGTDELASAFLDVGAKSYIAPTGAPFGYASTLVPILLFYEMTEMRPLEEAVSRLQGWDAELSMWRLWQR